MKVALMVRGFLQTPVPNDIAYSPAKIAQSVAEGLAGLGHEVTFYGPEGTQVKTTHIETCNLRPFANDMAELDNSVSTADMFRNYRFSSYDAVMARDMLVRAQRGEFDCVVFNHFESVLPLAPLFPDVPIVYILHDYIDEERRDLIEMHASPNQYFISISDSQRRAVPDLNYAATIHNGINPHFFAFDNDAEDYLMYSGRITPEKGIREAVQVAVHSGRRLLIAGSLSKQNFWYFDEHIKPFLNDKVLFLGMLGQEQIIKYYQKAAAILMPVQWEEPFGLSMAEANACGTPVIAFGRGAVPEVIKHGKTGYVVDNSAEMILAIEKIDKIKRRDCHEHAKKYFRESRMVKDYERTLQDIIANHPTVKRLKPFSSRTFTDSIRDLTRLIVLEPPKPKKKPKR